MSHEAIAAALAREDLSCGEQLVVFSLASFADRHHQARPGTAAAAGRAGMARSRFLEARARLVDRGLVVVEHTASGRGHASTVALPFAQTGPWWEGEINAALFETVLGYSGARGPARLVLAAIAALADDNRVLEGLTTERLCAAARVADRTYRRARAALLASGELVLRSGSGGRGNTNCWEIPDPRAQTGAIPPIQRRRRASPPAGARPLMAPVAAPAAVADTRAIDGMPGTGPIQAGVFEPKGGRDRTLSKQDRPAPIGVSASKGGQDRTVSGETPAQTPARTPAPNAPASREPQNPRTFPPSPPDGGSDLDLVLVEETYVTERGRTRRRRVPVDLGAVRARLRAAREADHEAWKQIRAVLLDLVGTSPFGIWLAPLELLAVDPDGTLVVSLPRAADRWIVSWVADRFGRAVETATDRVGRQLRIADEVECQAAGDLPTSESPDMPGGSTVNESAYPSSYTHVYTQLKEVS